MTAAASIAAWRTAERNYRRHNSMKHTVAQRNAARDALQVARDTMWAIAGNGPRRTA